MIFENNSKFELVSIYSGIAEIQRILKQEVDEDDYLDNALNCLRLIGNTYTTLTLFEGKTDENGKICLPTNAYRIESVTDGWDKWKNWGSKSNFYLEGKYLKYEYYYNQPLGTKSRYLILRDNPNTEISVLYKTYFHDENYLPLVTKEEAEACAYYYIYIKTLRETFNGNPNSAQLLAFAEKNKNIKINQARTVLSMSQNLMNELGHIIHTWDRKLYNRTNKPIIIS